MCQKYIFKIRSSRLRKNKWNLTLPLQEARRNDEIISLADSQILRWIDEINGIQDADLRAKEIKREIRRIKKEPNSILNKKTIRNLYNELDKIQFKADYMCLIIDSTVDYRRACKGFTINGIKYKRFVGTTNGVKNSTIVFVSERLYDELNRRSDNGRNMNKEIVPAKLEAYKALVCSASIPVSFPKGVLIVSDFETSFKSDIIYLSDDCTDEPVEKAISDYDVQLNACDGCGIMLPSLAERWSKEMELGYISSGFNTRFSFEKGMAFTFDFIDFAQNVADNYIVRDAWGNNVDIRNVELILTTSMVKLWDSYKSADDYFSNSKTNGYTFSITKTCPKRLENERTTNYQFLQSFDFDDNDIDELTAPTLNEISDVLGGDWRKTVLFLKGEGLNRQNVLNLDNDYIKAIMIEQNVLNDSYIQNSIYQLIKGRINEAKVGALKIHGNYSIVSGDPYALCQSIFGLEVTGLLKAGEIYNQYWADEGADKLSCFRAPMTCHNNIRLVSSVSSAEARYWYRHMNTCTIFNAWDTATAALNGCDFDGDLVMLTDNPVFLRRLSPSPALMCIQRRAQKCVPSEADLIQSNINSFGNDIGKVTNVITSMFEVRSRYEKDSLEYKELSYRIRCGQLYQQNAIDKTKGIVCSPMPRTWSDRHAVNKIADAEHRSFYRSIVADKKPYFMTYIYPSLMSQYKTYIKNANKNALRMFGVSVDELFQMPTAELTNEQSDFLQYYKYRMPVGTNGCVLNKICYRFEHAFDKAIIRRKRTSDFDYTVLKSEAEYTNTQYKAIKSLYNAYNQKLKDYMMFINIERPDKDVAKIEMRRIDQEFYRECSEICPNEKSLCNIVLDICYTSNATKRFAWSMCGETIIQNLLEKNHSIKYPYKERTGDLLYCGNTFKIEEMEVIDVDSIR